MIDIRQFFQMTNPSRTLDLSKPEDKNLYIDFSAVRGEEIIEELKSQITFFSPEQPTCTLFTGHIGCGKSTELLRLKADLEVEGFYVVYFESSEDLEMADVDIGDVLLAIAKRVSDSLEQLNLSDAKSLRGLLRGAAKLLMTEIEVEAEADLLGMGVAGNTDSEVSLAPFMS
ncbi:P-loop NTPase family protein [Leptothoe spongobia]|uniref:ATP-binding protein n=1 Tax=Leptothoe spongobia TAU-MAC 1115 TaxID=1967444 RepID=A0A947DF16_9CYAN|nr:ATP-binding protein [Leptothoe spongobia]MBT9315676.1 ATP-binding protein [Leptothoe spongobia TAU-MAC 1115]